MHNSVQYDPFQGQGHKHLKLEIQPFYNSYLLCHLQLELATEYRHGFLYYGSVSKFDWAGFVIFVIVFVSRDFEVGRNVTCE